MQLQNGKRFSKLKFMSMLSGRSTILGGGCLCGTTKQNNVQIIQNILIKEFVGVWLMILNIRYILRGVR